MNEKIMKRKEKKRERPRNKNVVFKNRTKQNKRRERYILVGTVLKFFVDDCLGRWRSVWLCGNTKSSASSVKSSHQTLYLSCWCHWWINFVKFCSQNCMFWLMLCVNDDVNQSWQINTNECVIRRGNDTETEKLDQRKTRWISWLCNQILSFFFLRKCKQSIIFNPFNFIEWLTFFYQFTFFFRDFKYLIKIYYFY